MIYRQFLETVLRAAAQLAADQFGKVAGTVKPQDSNQVLTHTDLNVGRMIIREIKRAYPDHNVIDEEAGVTDNQSDYTWVIDPIDGTSNFAAGLPFYGIMLGLIRGTESVAGGIVLPAFNELYLAEKGQGSFCNGKRVRVTPEKELINSLVVYQIDSHREKPEQTRLEAEIIGRLVLGIRNLRVTGSAYDIGMLAKGQIGGYLAQTAKIWDTVAPKIIIEEAGGLFTQFNGQPIDYSDPLKKAGDNFAVCAAPQDLHSQLQQLVHQTSDEKA